MEELVLALCLIYIFAVGYIFVRKADRFMHKHPQAFPGRQSKITVKPSGWQESPDGDPGVLPQAEKCRLGETEHDERNS